MTAGEGLAALGRALGLDALALDAQGACALQVDAGPAVHLQAAAEGEQGVLFAVVATLPPVADGGSRHLLRSLLEANCLWQGTGGATLGLDDESPPRVVLAQRVPWAQLGAPAFLDFAAQAAAWQARLEGAGCDADGDAPAGTAGPALLVPGDRA